MITVLHKKRVDSEYHIAKTMSRHEFEYWVHFHAQTLGDWLYLDLANDRLLNMATDNVEMILDSYESYFG